MTIARKKGLPAAGSLSTHNGFSLISDEKLLELYATMLKCSMLQERIRALSGRDGTGTGATTNKNIAVIAGVAIDLQSRDTLAPSRGGIVPCFVKGMPLAAVFAAARGRSSKGRPPYASFHLISPRFRFETQLDRAVAAVKAGRGRDRNVAVCFCGDSAESESDLARAMRHAGRKKIPIVFVRQSGNREEGIAQRTRGEGIPAVTVDENDAVAIYRVATEAIAHARRGSGPTLIDCRPWPVTARGRSSRRGVGDPIRDMESYLRPKKLLSGRFKSQVISDFQRELDVAAQKVR